MAVRVRGVDPGARRLHVTDLERRPGRRLLDALLRRRLGPEAEPSILIGSRLAGGPGSWGVGDSSCC